MELITISEDKAEAFPSVIKFEKDKTGKTNVLVLHDLVADGSIRVN